MASQGNDGMAADLVREVAGRARTMSARLEHQQPRELLDDLRDFARRRPGAFLLGCLAAGMLAGRLTRGAKDGQNGSGSGVHVTPTPTPALTSAETPTLAGTQASYPSAVAGAPDGIIDEPLASPGTTVGAGRTETTLPGDRP
jgi:hypothetical protein